MPKHISSVLEIREAGIMLKVGQTHYIRVLGALKQVPLEGGPIFWTEVKPRADPSVYEQYNSGSLKGPQDDPGAQDYHPQVATLFITRKGEPLFLKRDW
jgi:hypothetical protein